MIEKILSYDDLWETLKKTTKPILLYGMGDGADKVMNACAQKGIEISGVFASDGFVREKIFHSFRVTSYSAAKEKFGSFVVLLSFASSLVDVLDNVKKIASEQELYCPDVPVFGDGLFDKSFVTEHKNEFEKVYSLLSDDVSKENYIKIIRGKMTGRIDFLFDAETTVNEAYGNIIKPAPSGHYVDIGAYNGDTIREYMSFATSCSRITAFEPDERNFRKLCTFAEESSIDTAHFHNIAAWDKKETLTFYARSGRNSAGTTSHAKAKSIEIQADKPDSYIDVPCDFINIDAEGSDRNVLLGLEKTIAEYKPKISCAVYHRNEDMFALPMLLYQLYGGCRLYIRHFRYLPAWDTNVYACPF